MASMARSGETLLLKIMSVHPNVIVVHNLEEADVPFKLKAFQFFKSYPKKVISRSAKIVKPYGLKKKQVLLLKQGVWKHQHPFSGFVLSRNPVSIYSSLKSYDKDVLKYNVKDNFWFENTNRFRRWLTDIDPSKIDVILSKSPVEQFVDFYNLRMGDLALSGLPIIRYEDLVTNTKHTLERTCSYLGIPMEEGILKSHEFYDEGLVGHGQNDLSKPIDKSSLYKYKKNVTTEEFNYIKANTFFVHDQFGYKLEDGEIYF